MFGIGGFEFFIILLFAFIVFGPDKIPEAGKLIGRAIKKFREAKTEVDSVLEKETGGAVTSDSFRQPIQALERLGEVAAEKEAAKKAAESSTGQSTTESGMADSPELAGSNRQASAASSEARPEGADRSVPGESGPSTQEGERQQSSFAQRKARFEQERAVKLKAEALAAEASAANEDAANENAAEGGD